jgi:NAD(P)-dependent dehydrogenase (short-subunit alcohol dehydrogenase family)
MKDLFNLDGKTALVVGHKGNLGPIWMETLDEAGADVYSIGLPNCDVTDLNQVNEWGHIVPDIIIYNSAIDNPPNADEPNGWDMFRNYEDITAVNQFGLVNVLRVFIPVMKKNGGGSIHAIGSIMGYGPPDESNYPFIYTAIKEEKGVTHVGDRVWTKPLAYGASKRAYLNIAQWVTRKFGKDGIRMTIPAFGPIDMGQLSDDFMAKIGEKIPTGKFTTVDDLKRTLLYNVCCTNFAGQDTLVDGGYRER